MLSLYLLRHGETEFSQHDRFCGRIDAPLTADGREMAMPFAAAYGNLSWRAIVTSTRARAIDSAAPLAAITGLDACVDERLDEMDYGAWQGLSKAGGGRARSGVLRALAAEIPASDRPSANRRGTSPRGRRPPSSSS